MNSKFSREDTTSKFQGGSNLESITFKGNYNFQVPRRVKNPILAPSFHPRIYKR
jgi:hypothetical protein